MIYMSVERPTIQQAFATAHKLAEEWPTSAGRMAFLKIARLIWKACGEQNAMPAAGSVEFPVRILNGEGV